MRAVIFCYNNVAILLLATKSLYVACCYNNVAMIFLLTKFCTESFPYIYIYIN